MVIRAYHLCKIIILWAKCKFSIATNADADAATARRREYAARRTRIRWKLIIFYLNRPQSNGIIHKVQTQMQHKWISRIPSSSPWWRFWLARNFTFHPFPNGTITFVYAQMTCKAFVCVLWFQTKYNDSINYHCSVLCVHTVSYEHVASFVIDLWRLLSILMAYGTW